MSQIAELADVSPSAITQAARKLEREGFVQRRRDETDQRVVWIDVTRKAREAVKVLEAAQRERLAAMLSVLSESQQNALRDLLEATAAPLHQNPPEGEVSRE
jgi:DNA-binding MarR family transcriptional regulator